MRVAPTTRDVLFGFSPRKFLVVRFTPIDGHGIVAIGENVVESPFVIIDSGYALGYPEVGIVPSEGGMPDDVAQTEGRQGQRSVVFERL